MGKIVGASKYWRWGDKWNVTTNIRQVKLQEFNLK